MNEYEILRTKIAVADNLMRANAGVITLLAAQNTQLKAQRGTLARGLDAAYRASYPSPCPVALVWYGVRS